MCNNRWQASVSKTKLQGRGGSQKTGAREKGNTVPEREGDVDQRQQGLGRGREMWARQQAPWREEPLQGRERWVTENRGQGEKKK